jgi:excisionase family DNA binding protein
MGVTRSRPSPGRNELRLYTIPETADLMGGVSEMHVYRQIAAGELRAVDIASPGAGRPKTRVRSDDLTDYIERRTRGRASRTA